MASAQDWTKPQAMAIPKEGYFTLEKGRYTRLVGSSCSGATFTAAAVPVTSKQEAREVWGRFTSFTSSLAGIPDSYQRARLRAARRNSRSRNSSTSGTCRSTLMSSR